MHIGLTFEIFLHYYNLQVFFVCLWILVVSLKIAIRIPCLHFCVEIFLMKGNILVCNVTFLFCFFSCLMIVHTDYFILFDIWISREMFNKWQAQRWWAENYDKVMELYNVQRFNQQAVPLPTPPRSEDEVNIQFFVIRC